MNSSHHWSYFAALEEDVESLSRFIHFSAANLGTYSIELARLLMASTQEVDVLFKQICAKHGDKSTKEPGYRNFFAKGDYAKIRSIEISAPRFGLTFKPYENWINQAPDWWTANNKVKHQRHTEFERASLGNVLSSLSGLLIANIYYANEEGTLQKDLVSLKLLSCKKLVRTNTMAFAATGFKVP